MFKKGCTRLATASDNVYQLLAHGRWFSPGTPASSTTKAGHHDIAEILLKVVLNTNNQSINIMFKIIVFLIIMLFTQLYVRVSISLTFGKHLNDHIISLKGEVWTHK
jgi:hypothetical protein